MAEQAVWTDDLYRILREWNVTQFSYVPDAGHAVAINRSLEDPDVHSIPLTREGGGVVKMIESWVQRVPRGVMNRLTRTFIPMRLA